MAHHFTVIATQSPLPTTCNAPNKMQIFLVEDMLKSLI